MRLTIQNPKRPISQLGLMLQTMSKNTTKQGQNVLEVRVNGSSGLQTMLHGNHMCLRHMSRWARHHGRVQLLSSS
jgi:hypothetical protein